MWWLARLIFTTTDGVRIPAWVVKFDVANLYMLVLQHEEVVVMGW